MKPGNREITEEKAELKNTQSERADSLYEQVIWRNSEAVYRLAYALVRTRADADDIFQEVFLRYMQKEPAFEGAEHERAWFLRVTINCSKNFWKSPWLRRRVVMEPDALDEAVAEGAQVRPESGCGSDDDGAVLIETVRQLPGKYRVVIHLFYYEELSIREIAKITNAKESTVRTRLTRARRKLKDLLSGNQQM